MEYFKLLPTVAIDNNNFRNIFQKYYVSFVNEDQIIQYRILEGERLEDISYKFYGTLELWWIIAILNNITDIVRDLPMTQELTQAVARSSATTNNILDMQKFVEVYDQLQAKNDEKRVIRIIRPEKLNEIIIAIMKQINE